MAEEEKRLLRANGNNTDVAADSQRDLREEDVPHWTNDGWILQNFWQGYKSKFKILFIYTWVIIYEQK